MTICQQEEREAGRAYPRTCPTCRLGPCQKYGSTPLATLEALRAENTRLKVENERLRSALSDVIGCDHHNFLAGPPPKFVRIARAALAQKKTRNASEA